GHIASLFPGDDGWRKARPETHIVAGCPDGLVPRLSLSALRVRTARWTALLVTGKAKRAVLDAVLEGTRDLPVALLLNKAPPAQVFWAYTT
ncbi:MAG: 6-phosphogluconolactonase, partial [Bosea sp. (in: a-proteobacteria)]